MNKLWRQFHDAGFSDIWYANPGPAKAGRPDYALEPRWFAGVWSGPDYDVVCIKHCISKTEIERLISPPGHSPEEAVELALTKLRSIPLRAR
jgi:hypothetical protein